MLKTILPVLDLSNKKITIGNKTKGSVGDNPKMKNIEKLAKSKKPDFSKANFFKIDFFIFKA